MDSLYQHSVIRSYFARNRLRNKGTGLESEYGQARIVIYVGGINMVVSTIPLSVKSLPRHVERVMEGSGEFHFPTHIPFQQPLLI